jgi:hypothetical protein
VSGQERDFSSLRDPIVEEHVLNNHPLPALDTIRGLPLVCEQLLELRGQ